MDETDEIVPCPACDSACERQPGGLWRCEACDVVWSPSEVSERE